ncbi:hypothetical protein ACVIHI_000551 [Bradyrhizobium sp. USDA 4524]|nr:hypothetical protein [Bradyrhizobium sp. USDA 4538]MCP1898641.1 hypothetical protein [Bradyrhizobium sp. USDA 4537]MCP1987248.1 hypothetical protein [Bradyrhizobium sp. USDA 4539]
MDCFDNINSFDDPDLTQTSLRQQQVQGWANEAGCLTILDQNRCS